MNDNTHPNEEILTSMGLFLFELLSKKLEKGEIKTEEEKIIKIGGN